MNMWKTVSARIRGATSELVEMGEDTDGVVESTSKLRDIVLGMTGFDIMVDEDTYKDLYEIMVGIGEQWENLTDIEQASLLETLAGKQQSNALAAVLNNIDVLQESYDQAMGSAGSATAEQEKYQESIQYSIDRTKASLEELSAVAIDSSGLKNLIELGNSAIEIFTKLLDTFGALPTALGVIGGVLGAKNQGKPLLYQLV